jgi:hypothetical protein
MKEPMEALDYIEEQGKRGAEFSAATLELMTTRANALLTLLLAGAGGTGSYALSQLGEKGNFWALCTLGAVSLWWFALAAYVLLHAIRTRTVRAPATEPFKLLQHLRGPLTTYVAELKKEGQPEPVLLDLLREGEIETLEKTVLNYKRIGASIALALDSTYLAIVVTPAIALMGSIVAYRLS